MWSNGGLMSDRSGLSAGWHPDPQRRHEYRYRDDNGWTDQVSDGGVVSTDPPGFAMAASSVPPVRPARKKVPVGILALVGLVVASAVAGLVILLAGGDDGDGGDGGIGDGGDGGGESVAGEFSGSVSADEPFVVRTFDLAAGEVVRVRVQATDGDLDPRLTLAVESDLAATQIFGFDADEDDPLASWGSNFDDLFSDSLESDLSADLSDSLSEDFSDYQDELADGVPSLEDAGVPLFSFNDGSQDEPEHLIFMAPLGGQYSVIVGGIESEGDFEGEIGTVGPSEEFEEQDADEDLDAEAYHDALEPLLDELCDEEFWAVDLSDLSDLSSAPEDVCEADDFDDILSGSSFEDFFTDDVSDDFSSDFSDDFSEDFSDDFSSDFPDDPATGTAVDPTVVIVEYGTNDDLDFIADACFGGDYIACDDLYRVSPVGGIGSYEDYGASCGYRVEEAIPGQCEATLG